MEKRILCVFLMEVERQCKFALIAAYDLERAVGTLNADRVWYSVQAFLIAAGNISKLLWGVKRAPEASKRRAGALRASLSVEGDSPLSPRTFRDHFEHFDERLDMWAAGCADGGFIDSNIGPAGFAGSGSGHCLRHFDTANWAVTYRGDVYHLRPIIRAIDVLRRTATAEFWKNTLRPDFDPHMAQMVIESEQRRFQNSLASRSR